MVKYYYFILLLILLGNTLSSTYMDNCTYYNTNDENQCFDLLDEDAKDNGYSCCYVSEKDRDGVQHNYCNLMEKEEADDYKLLLEGQGSSYVEINCFRSYLNYSLLMLLFLFFYN